ncbi:MAG: arsenite methyltransferase [Candidatus Latescibacterota bacterium]|jgi:arsenite methyltransferase
MADVETQVEEETCCEPECCSDDIKATDLSADELREAVSDRYGRIAEGYEDSCCGSPTDKAGAASMRMGYSQEDVTHIPEGANMGLGCGNPQAIANLKAGETVVDLGSGGGFDCFLSAKAVGETGQVIGVDMTPVMIRKARANAEKIDAQNVTFRLGEIEYPPVADNTADVIISNCVINLSPDQPQVYREAFRMLKSGGRLAISDMVASQPLTDEIRDDLAKYTGCMAGAPVIDDLENMLKEAGFTNIQIAPKDESKTFIKDWAPEMPVEDYVVSATIEATKP